MCSRSHKEAASDMTGAVEPAVGVSERGFGFGEGEAVQHQHGQLTEPAFVHAVAAVARGTPVMAATMR